MGLKYVDFLKDFVSLVYPDTCYACDAPLVSGEKIICLNCQSDLPKTDYHLHDDNDLKKKFSGTEVSNTLAYFRFTKKERTQKLLYAFKYGGVQHIGRLLGEWYGYELKPYCKHYGFDRVVPLPLHKKKKRKRGFNQSEVFAKSLAKVLDLPLEVNCLHRVQMTPTQTNKSREERWDNVKDAFLVVNGGAIQDQHILLVDDIVTTGATLEAAAKSLLNAGAAKVSIVAIADA